MFKTIIICEKCKEETPAYDDGSGLLIIDFEKAQFVFHCPKCGVTNTLDFGDIKKALASRTRLPSIGIGR